MKRRTLLHNSALLGTSALSACLGTGESTKTTVTTDDPTSEMDSDCPSFVAGTERSICNRMDPNATPIYLRPEDDVFTVVTDNNIVETFQFTLQIQADKPFTLTPDAWYLQQKNDDSEWRQIAMGNADEDVLTIHPEGSHIWSLSLAPHPTPRGSNYTYVVANLPDAGTYAFVLTGELGSGDDTSNVEVYAIFDFKRVQKSE